MCPRETYPEPIVRRCKSLRQRTHTLIKHLRVEDPRSTIPRGRVRRGPQVEKGHGADPARGQRSARLGSQPWLGEGNIAANVPHAQRAGNAAEHEQFATSELVDQEEKPEDSHDCLDDTEDARC